MFTHVSKYMYGHPGTYTEVVVSHIHVEKLCLDQTECLCVRH